MSNISGQTRTKPGSRAAVEQALNHYGLILDSYRPDRERLYAVEVKETNFRLSDRMNFSHLKAWTQGYIAAREGRPSVHI